MLPHPGTPPPLFLHLYIQPLRQSLKHTLKHIFRREKATNSRFGRICVFCGSSPGNKEIYTKAAFELGKEFVYRGINLVYGGGSLGLMGAVAGTVHHGGRHVLGINPKHLMPYIRNSFGDLQVVEDMHARKAGMMEHADAFIALPGGYGTLEELSEVLCWAQLGIHKKPVGVLNIDGFYDLFLLHADKMVENAFLAPEHRALLISASTPRELIEKMEEKA